MLTMLALPSLVLGTMPHTVEPQAVLEVETPLWTGEFSTNVQRDARAGSVTLTLSGRMQDAIDSAQTWSSKIDLTFDETSMRTFETSDSVVSQDTVTKQVEIFTVDRVAPQAAAWTLVGGEALGSVLVWQGADPEQVLTNNLVAGLTSALIGTEGSPECAPTFAECLAAAQNTCDKLGSFSHECSEDPPSVTCDFSCLQSPPE